MADEFSNPSGGSSGIGGATGSTDNAVLRADGTGGLTAQGSAVIIDDDGNVIIPNDKFLIGGNKELIGWNSGGGRFDINGTLDVSPVRINGSNFYFYDTVGPELIFRIDARGGLAATETAMQLWDKDNNTLERVTVGAADSGGAGFKVLRIPN